MTTQVNILGALYEMGAWDRLIAVADQAIPEAEAMGNRYSLARMRHNRSLAALGAGRLFDRTPAACCRLNAIAKIMGDFRWPDWCETLWGWLPKMKAISRKPCIFIARPWLTRKRFQAATEIAYAQHDLGALLLRLGQPWEAIPLLEAAREAWSKQENLLLRVKERGIPWAGVAGSR